jgi:hypothetical protein
VPIWVHNQGPGGCPGNTGLASAAAALALKGTGAASAARSVAGRLAGQKATLHGDPVAVLACGAAALAVDWAEKIPVLTSCVCERPSCLVEDILKLLTVQLL